MRRKKRSERCKKILLEASFAAGAPRTIIPVLTGVEKPSAAFARASVAKLMLSELARWRATHARIPSKRNYRRRGVSVRSPSAPEGGMD